MKKDTGNPVIQSNKKTREKLHERVTIGFGFTTDWMKSGVEFLNQALNVIIQNQSKYEAQVKTVL